MTWSPSLVVVGIWLVIGFLLGLLELLLKYYWRDRRTRKHKTARKWLFILFVVSSVTALVLTMREKSSAEKQSKRLAQALDEAANERKIHTMAGRLETQHGMGQTFMFGGSTFVLMNSSSFFDGMGLSRVAPKIAEQNSIKVSNTFDGKLSVSARICGRDGLIAEIKDNEWKIAPPPKTWDRNYSTNALEVMDAEGEIVFQIKIENDARFANQSVFHFQGIFFDSNGNGIAFTTDPNSRGGIMSYLSKNDTQMKIPHIKPLFKYPSELHLGELAEQN